MNLRRDLDNATDDRHVAAKEAFDNSVKNPLVEKLIDNIESRFTSSDTMASFTIFNPANLPKEEIESDEDTETETKSFEEYGFDHVKALSKRFGRANISENEILTEYENFKHYMSDHLRNCKTHEILLKLTDNKSLKSLFPAMSFFAAAYKVLPPHTADCERDFSQLKLIKTILRNRMSETTLDALMRITVEGPKLQDFPFQRAVKLWAEKKSRRLKI